MRLPPKLKKIKKNLKLKYLIHPIRVVFWFSIGAFFAIFFISSFSLYAFKYFHRNVVYPGVMINGVDVGNKTPDEVKSYFAQKNSLLKDTTFTFKNNSSVATISAEKIDYGYDKELLANQAYSIGRSPDTFANISLIVQAYLNGINLNTNYAYSEPKLDEAIANFSKTIHKEPKNALFQFDNNRVTTFAPSEDGQTIDKNALNKKLLALAPSIMHSPQPQTIEIEIPIKILKPSVSTDQANNLGIKELIGTGTSLFYHSIPNRIHNVELGTSKFNGILVKPGETFSFNKILGDVSVYTGYKQAYVIQNGRTVLGDGGGICQVSTTLFRALLNAGLPIVERHAHAYRVGYYEQDAGPGLDATVYSPSVDLRFKNDTGNYILIQTQTDTANYRVTFSLYGTKDGRVSVVNPPVITSQTPAPADVYQDDPNLLKGQVNQVDFAAPGATVYFTRLVTRNNQTIISDKFYSNYQPWAAIYIRGTKE